TCTCGAHANNPQTEVRPYVRSPRSSAKPRDLEPHLVDAALSGQIERLAVRVAERAGGRRLGRRDDAEPSTVLVHHPDTARAGQVDAAVLVEREARGPAGHSALPRRDHREAP